MYNSIVILFILYLLSHLYGYTVFCCSLLACDSMYYVIVVIRIWSIFHYCYKDYVVNVSLSLLTLGTGILWQFLSQHSMGCGTQARGEVELMVHRNLQQDDGRGAQCIDVDIYYFSLHSITTTYNNIPRTFSPAHAHTYTHIHTYSRLICSNSGCFPSRYPIVDILRSRSCVTHSRWCTALRSSVSYILSKDEPSVAHVIWTA